MRILITGSNGLLGSKLIDACRASNTEFLATARGENRNSDLMPHQFQSMDIADADEVARVVDGFQPTVLIHGAAMTQVDECEFDRTNAWKLNAEAVRIVAEVCAARGIHLIHIGTDFVFDGSEGPYDEEGIPNPLSYYGFTKWVADQLVMHTPKLKWTILRTVLVYGYSPSLGRSNIVLWLRKSLKEGAPIQVVDDQYRTPTLAEDLAQACLSAARKRVLGLFHISGPEGYTIYELAQAVAKHLGLDASGVKRVKSIDINQPALRPPTTGFVIDKAKHELEYHPHTLKEALDLIQEQMRRNGAD
jgi:dTDP-4-dehydrorhamnose reductase